MAVTKLRKAWDQSAFVERAEDAEALRHLRGLAMSSPTLKDALDWADAHGVRIAVDPELDEDTLGEYSHGTGIVRISPQAIARGDAPVVRTLTHEIRHAWQDYHGLWKNSSDVTFATLCITQALIEADASAFGQTAREEYMQGGAAVRSEKLLAEKFMEWFDTRANVYGRNLLPAHLERFVQEMERLRDGADKPPVRKIGSRLDLESLENVMPLGRDFRGTINYFTRLRKDELPKFVLRPSLAYDFWGRRSGMDVEIAIARKGDFLLRRQSPRPRHPWP